MYQIKVGDVLKTRLGKTVRILCNDARRHFPVVGLVDDEDKELIYYWTKNGRFVDDRNQSDYDLILPTSKTKCVAPVLWKRRDGKWVIDILPISKEIFFTTKEDCSPSGIWLEHLAIEVPDED